MSLTNRELELVHRVLNSPEVKRAENEDTARRWRGEVTADWLSNFFTTMMNKEPINTLQKKDPTLNKETGQRHTVESMVGDLRERVQLDMVKAASPSEIPLSAHAGLYDISQYNDDNKDEADQSCKEKEGDALLEDIAEYVTTYFMKPNRGHVDFPAVIDACKDRYGEEKLLSMDSDKLKKVILDARNEFKDDNATKALLPYSGDPQPVGHGLDEKDPMDTLNGPSVYTK